MPPNAKCAYLGVLFALLCVGLSHANRALDKRKNHLLLKAKPAENQKWSHGPQCGGGHCEPQPPGPGCGAEPPQPPGPGCGAEPPQLGDPWGGCVMGHACPCRANECGAGQGFSFFPMEDGAAELSGKDKGPKVEKNKGQDRAGQPSKPVSGEPVPPRAAPH